MRYKRRIPRELAEDIFGVDLAKKEHLLRQVATGRAFFDEMRECGECVEMQKACHQHREYWRLFTEYRQDKMRASWARTARELASQLSIGQEVRP